MPSPREYAKAIVATLVAALTALGVGLTDGVVTPAEGVAVALAAVVAFGGVYATPNAGPALPVDVDEEPLP